jgi:hypothetical protein
MSNAPIDAERARKKAEDAKNTTAAKEAAWREYLAKAPADRAKTERLRTLRLEKEAAERAAAAAVAPAPRRRSKAR